MERIDDKGDNKNMNENLSQMVKDGPTDEPIVFSENDLDIPAVSQRVSEEEQEGITAITLTSLADWFESNSELFTNIGKPTVTITHVDTFEQLIITTLISIIDGVEKRKLVVFDDAHLWPVLNIPAVDMQAYNNHTFRIIYDFSNGIYIKSYGVRNSLISVFCNDINDQLIPYEIVRAKKHDSEIEIIHKDPAEVKAKLAEPLDVESLQLRYKQSVKAEGLTTNQDAVSWLLERQGSIEDINHHLQIDNVIIDTLE